MAKDKITCFIECWDSVIRDWLDKKDLGVQEEFLSNKSLKLSRDEMPEPYWGNPNKCSIVIVNYNPYGNNGRNIHSYRAYADCPDSFINEVKNKKYSEVVFSFPILDSSKPNAWWRDFGGAAWWQKKKKWLEDFILTPLNIVSNHKPFALDFCAWHSKNWRGNIASMYKKGLKEYIDKYFVRVLINAIRNSDYGFGVCLSSQFNSFLLKSIGATPLTDIIDMGAYKMRLFQLDNVNVLNIWGMGYNRSPKVSLSGVIELLKQKNNF